jgi:hypothetical protein
MEVADQIRIAGLKTQQEPAQDQQDNRAPLGSQRGNDSAQVLIEWQPPQPSPTAASFVPQPSARAISMERLRVVSNAAWFKTRILRSALYAFLRGCAPPG